MLRTPEIRFLLQQLGRRNLLAVVAVGFSELVSREESGSRGLLKPLVRDGSVPPVLPWLTLGLPLLRRGTEAVIDGGGMPQMQQLPQLLCRSEKLRQQSLLLGPFGDERAAEEMP